MKRCPVQTESGSLEQSSSCACATAWEHQQDGGALRPTAAGRASLGTHVILHEQLLAFLPSEKGGMGKS